MSKTTILVQTFSMAAASFLLVAASTPAQSSSAATTTKKAETSASKNWKVPRTADGHPSFEGVWANNWITPTQRPDQWAGKAMLTDAELEDFKKRVAEVDPSGDALFGDELVQAALTRKQTSDDPTTGNYNQFWNPDRDIDNRTSLITDPADGKMPPLTPEAQAAMKARPPRNRNKADGPEDLGLSVRCITFGFPRTQAAYDSYFQIVQAPNTIAIMQEAIHETRTIPIGDTPHVAPNVREWLGDSRAHWEGDTLVIDTTNFSAEGSGRATQNLHVIEKYTRASEDYLNWEITYIDPNTWTKPWTEMIRLKKSDQQLYEYACHEGNYALPDILAGARADEAKQAQAMAAKKTVNQ